VPGKNNTIVGTQWGDEGKGKVVDILSKKADIVARFQGGANAGHTIVIDGQKRILHLVPSGIFQEKTTCVIGNGVVLDPFGFLDELEALRGWDVDYEGRILISGATNLILTYHKKIDGLREKNRGAGSIGTTGRGIGPAYADKIARTLAIRISDLVDSRDDYNCLKVKLEANRIAKAHFLDDLSEKDQIDWDDLFSQLKEIADIFRPMMINASLFLDNAYKEGKSITFEGAQGGMLDVDLGSHPFVTSSHPGTGGALTGLGIGPKVVGEVVGIVKAYTTRVGGGPFPTELFDEIGETLYKNGEEVGASTGRDRRCGWLDLVVLRHTFRINGVEKIAITKLDVLDGFEEIKVCVAYMLDGEKITEMPVDMSRLADCTPVYETLPGWQDKTRGVTSLDELPKEAKSYINFILKQLGVEAALISTGPDRKDTIMVN